MEQSNSTSGNDTVDNSINNTGNVSTTNNTPNDTHDDANINILPNDDINGESDFDTDFDTDEGEEVENGNVHVDETLELDENEEEQEENYEQDTEDEEEYGGYIPGFPQFFIPPNMGIPFGSILGSTNFHILGNLNNVQGMIDMMANNMLNTHVPNNLVNPLNQVNNIINEINPSNSGNSVLANTTFAGQPINLNMNSIGNQALIEEEIHKLILSGVENLNLVSQPVLDFIDSCYLQNMQYEDDIINLIRYTVKNCLTRRSDFELKELISGIIYYSFSGANAIFSENYDDVVLPILQNELKRIVTQSIRLAILRRTIVPPRMEDVKLVVGEEALEKIPISKYADLEDKIKNMNVSCTVCQDDFNTEDKVRVLPCEHLYHPDCIDDWLKEHSYKCPCCRKPAAEHSAKI